MTFPAQLDEKTVFIPLYWVGQKVPSSFSIALYRRIQMKFVANSIYSRSHCGRLIDDRTVGCSWGLRSFALSQVSLLPGLPCIEYHSSVVLCKVWEGYASCFVLDPHCCFRNSESCMVLCKF